MPLFLGILWFITETKQLSGNGDVIGKSKAVGFLSGNEMFTNLNEFVSDSTVKVPN